MVLTPHNTSVSSPHSSLDHYWRLDNALWQQRCLLWAAAWLRRGSMRDCEREREVGKQDHHCLLSRLLLPSLQSTDHSLLSLSSSLALTAAFHSLVFPPERETAAPPPPAHRPATKYSSSQPAGREIFWVSRQDHHFIPCQVEIKPFDQGRPPHCNMIFSQFWFCSWECKVSTWSSKGVGTDRK